MARGPKVVRLKKPRIDPESRFIATLVWVLDMARQGRVTGYAMVFDVEGDESGKLVEASDVGPDADPTRFLGAIRRMELGFIKRQWPETFD